MGNKSTISSEYRKIIDENPDKKFALYLRSHPEDEEELIHLNDLSKTYGEYRELQRERIAIFILNGKKINEFISKLNSFDTQMYLSFIQSEDEIKN